MTEAQWLSCTDPRPMLEILKSQATDRKLRLFACACVAALRPLDPRIEQALLVAERCADGEAGDGEQAAQARKGPQSQPGAALNSWLLAADMVGISMLIAGQLESPLKEAAAGCLRELFGNPFRPLPFDAAWRTPDVMSLAAGIYGERAFYRVPVLADALKAAGCRSEAILSHCRSGGPHVRGCWVLDLVLGKA